MATTAQVHQTFDITWPAPLDKDGNPGSFEEGFEFSVSDDSKGSIVARPDLGPFSATVTTKGVVGAFESYIDGDGDLGEGVKPIRGIHVTEVTGGDSVGFGEATATVPVDVTPGPETPEEAFGRRR